MWDMRSLMMCGFISHMHEIFKCLGNQIAFVISPLSAKLRKKRDVRCFHFVLHVSCDVSDMRTMRNKICEIERFYTPYIYVINIWYICEGARVTIYVLGRGLFIR